MGQSAIQGEDRLQQRSFAASEVDSLINPPAGITDQSISNEMKTIAREYGVGSGTVANHDLKTTTIDDGADDPVKSTTGIGWATAGLNLASAGAGIASGFINASIARTRGEMAQQRAQFNAKMATLTAQNVLAQADEDAVSFLEQVGTKIIGRQRVAHASQNVKVGTGVSKQLESDARAKAQERVVAIKANAQDRAFGLVTAAMDSTAAGEEAMLAARSGAINSILGGSAFGVERASSAMDTYMKSIKGGNNGTSA